MARYRYFVWVVVLFSIFMISGNVSASEAELLAEIRALQVKVVEMDQLKAQVADLQKEMAEHKKCLLDIQGTTAEVRKSLQEAVPMEKFIKYTPGEGVEIAPCGFKIQADATFILQGTPNANAAADGTHKARCDASWSSDIFISKSFDDWGLAFMHLEPGQGTGAEDQLSVYSNVDRDSNDTGSNVPVTELWYEQYLFDKQIAITAGKLDPANYLDQNEYAADETTQFIGRMFRNSPAIEWPNDNTLGGTIAIAPSWLPFVAANASYYNANNSWEDVFSKPFISTELTFMPAKAFGFNEDKWGGHYRVYWWYNGLDHSKLVDQGEMTPDVVKERNYGVGLSFDQMLTDLFGVFARVGWQRPDLAIASTNPNVAPCEGSWSAGLQVNGKIWCREDDVIGIAVGQVLPSQHYKDAGNGGAGEGHFEAYYRFKVNSNLYISPDIQCIWNPRGISEPYQGDNNTIFVYGVRGQLDF